MSACINAISFRPSILKLSIEEIKQHLDGDAHAVTIRNVSGSMTLLPLKDVDQLWESGRKPQLISEDTVCDYSRL
jgi:hypothetical protein